MKKLLILFTLTLGFSQAGVSQKVIDFTFDTGETVTLDDILPDYDLEWALIRVIECPTNACWFENQNNGQISLSGLWTQNDTPFFHNVYGSIHFFDSDVSAQVSSGVLGIYTMKVLVTAEFPSDSDVQLRKTGLQSKDKKTVE